MAQVIARRHDDDDWHAALAGAGAGNLATFGGAQGGGWVEEDTKDPNIIEKARFAVDEKNKQLCRGKLDFVAVTSAESKTVAGVNYRLTISVEDGNSSDLYDARVFQRLDGKNKLISFERVN